MIKRENNYSPHEETREKSNNALVKNWLRRNQSTAVGFFSMWQYFTLKDTSLHAPTNVESNGV